MRVTDLPLRYNAVEILEQNLVERADKIALYSLEREMTFREVSREVNQVGNALKKLGVRVGDFVGLLSLDVPEWVTCFFGILKVGGVAIGMNTLLKPQDYAYILDDSRTRVLIVHETLLPAIQEIRAGREFLEHVIVIGEQPGDISYRDWLSGEATELKTAPTHRDDFCTLNYSSGTTGQPKGILHYHKDHPVSAQLYAVNTLGMQEDDRTFSVARLFFTYGLGVNLVFPWYVGASIVLSSKPPRIATTVLEYIDRFKPTMLFNVPTGYASILAVENFAERYDLSSLRFCVSAGEALPAALWHAWKEQTGLAILEGMGTTENYAIFLSNRPDDIRPGSTGKPVNGFELKIADEQGHPVPPGVIGDLIVKGETATLFYLHQYRKSQQMFHGEWLCTGDKFYMDEEGYYWYVGRFDEMLKVGGIWVSPVEIEQTLFNHPAVLECAVIGQPDHDGLIKPKALVALNKGYTPSDELAQALIEYCKEKMAAYKRPRWITFIDELPKTGTGKIQRSALRDL